MRRLVLAAIASFLLTAPSQAVPITYNVDLEVGTAHAAGFIQTDGTLGVLDATNFLNWNLQLTNGSFSLTLNSAVDTLTLFGSALTAQSTGLFFDFNSADGSGLLFAAHLGFEDMLGAISGVPSTMSLNLQSVGDPNSPQWTPTLKGNTQIGSAAVAVPSPLVGAGLPGFVMALGGFLAWRRRKALAA